MTIFEQEIFNEIAHDYIQQFKNAIETKPIKRKSRGRSDFESVVNASGNLAKSPRIEITDNELNIYVLGYIDSLIYGQPPQKINTTVFEIENWMNSKGVEYSAVSVLDNLQQYGNSIFQKFHGANSGLLEDINLEGSINKAKEKLILKKIKEITYGINPN